MRALIALLAFALFASAATYTIKSGDTLGGIAKRHGVSAAALAEANGITDPDRIYAGKVLTIPGAASTPSPAPRSVRHVIGPGETLGAIAKRYGVSVAALAKANGIGNPNRITAGAVLTLPGSAQWVCPVAARSRFVDDFGVPRGGGRSHEGIDMVAARGTPIVAPVAGLLERRDQPRGGIALYLRGDDGLTYYFAHLDGVAARDGRVRLGQHIGSVGDTGNAAGGPVHLHFEIINQRGPRNPFPELSRHCARG